MIIPPKTNMLIKSPPFEDVFPIEHGDFPASHASFRGSMLRRNIFNLGLYILQMGSWNTYVEKEIRIYQKKNIFEPLIFRGINVGLWIPLESLYDHYVIQCTVTRLWYWGS